jgi:hypothetical protein
MRNIAAFILIAFAVCFTACHGRYRTVTIALNNNTESIKIKYSGEVKFNGDTSAIQSISPGGFLIYTHNDKKLTADSDEKGLLTIEMKDGKKSLTLDATGKQFMADAIRDMLAQGMHPSPKDGLEHD